MIPFPRICGINYDTATWTPLAKHVLRYLSSTRTLALCLGSPFPRIPSSLSGYMQNVGCADVDWASNTVLFRPTVHGL